MPLQLSKYYGSVVSKAGSYDPKPKTVFLDSNTEHIIWMLVPNHNDSGTECNI